MDTEDVVYTYNGNLIMKRNEIMPLLATWTDPETVTSREVRPRKTNIT